MRSEITAALAVAGIMATSCGGSGPPGAQAPAEIRPGSSALVADHEPRKAGSAFTVRNGSGLARTIRVGGEPVIDERNPFFQPLGTNGRSCATCHVASENMTVTPRGIQARFADSGGTDPIFRLVDGSNSPNADVSSLEARRAAYSMLLTKGLIRVGIGVPEHAEFELLAVDDPHGFASARELSLFRRPLPATNLKFLSTVMWDGRETFKDPTQATGFAPLPFDLADQSNAATLGHAQGAQPLTEAQRQAIVRFETELTTAQVQDDHAGDLRAGATGGPRALSNQTFFFGINDPLGGNPTGAPFDPVVMTEYAAWSGSEDHARASIARGEEIFNDRPIDINGVSGLNDDLHLDSIPGTCTTCHDAPHAGDHSVPAPLRIGIDAPQPVGGLDASGLPIYTLRNLTTGEIEKTTDPGRALVTGKWKDVGRFKGPVLRGLAGRAPYFHNGSAPDLSAVVEFYDARFGLGLSDRDKADLIAFLGAL
jgi:cytochrome c peroxidase